MINKESPVQGYVIYAEFTRSGATRQIFFTPDGYTTSGRFITMKAHYRTVSKDYPRKQWKITSTYGNDVNAALAANERGEAYDLSTFTEEWAERRIEVIDSYLRTIIAGDWQMVGTPLVVEASKYDLDDIAGLKTPTKILYRIKQSRAAAGFPEDLF